MNFDRNKNTPIHTHEEQRRWSLEEYPFRNKKDEKAQIYSSALKHTEYASSWPVSQHMRLPFL